MDVRDCIRYKNEPKIIVYLHSVFSWSAKGFRKAINVLIARLLKLLDTGIRFFLTNYASWPT